LLRIAGQYRVRDGYTENLDTGEEKALGVRKVFSAHYGENKSPVLNNEFDASVHRGVETYNRRSKKRIQNRRAAIAG
jgi:hypothetical protein